MPIRSAAHDLHRSAVRTFKRADVPRSAVMFVWSQEAESIDPCYAIVHESTQREGAERLDAWATFQRLASRRREHSRRVPRV
jgi:hypothetical protein